MEDNKREASFLVFVGFLFLFVLFLFFSPDEKSSGNVIIGSVALGENPSVITLLILFLILVIILAAVFVIFRKLKKKKTIIESPKPTEIKQNAEEKKEEKPNFNDEDVDKLFSGNGEEKKEEISGEKAALTEKRAFTRREKGRKAKF